jgi:hypothetical protein
MTLHNIKRTEVLFLSYFILQIPLTKKIKNKKIKNKIFNLHEQVSI